MKKLTALLAALAALVSLVLPASAQGYGSSTDPAELASVVEEAKALPTVQDLYFDPATELLENSAVEYYSDDSMLCLVWKKPVGKTLYHYFEVCIADASQFGRYVPGIPAVGGDRQTVVDMASRLGAVMVSSGDFYGLRGISVVVNEGKVLRADSQMMLDLCMVDHNGDLHCIPQGELNTFELIEQYVEENDINFGLEFGPTIFEDGVRLPLPEWYIMGQNNGEFTRAALCQMGPLHYMIVIASAYGYYWQAPTLEAFCDVLEEAHPVTAYTIDGGQTASVAFNGRLINQVNYGGMRAVSDGLYFMAGQ